jgi:hypothetical protein
MALHTGSARQAERITASIRPVRHGDGLVVR